VQRSRTAAGVQETTSLMEPHRYIRLGDLASALRKAGHACETVRSYNQLDQNLEGTAVYKVDCLEYSYRLTVKNGRGRVDRWTADSIRE
jgi:hypothetical protein